jgi:prepilin-type N-terminal cleavage/methylation domain-containing protein
MNEHRRLRPRLVMSPWRRPVRHGQLGMTMLEVLIAIMLFAVFSGVMVMVSELIAAMLSSDQKSATPLECGATPTDRACVELFFDDLVETLEQPTFSLANLRAALRQCKPSAGQLLNLNYDQIPAAVWPEGYEICLYDYGSVNSRFIEDLSTDKPGLYLLQAQPVVRSPLKAPVQRLFCRPRSLCS